MGGSNGMHFIALNKNMAGIDFDISHLQNRFRVVVSEHVASISMVEENR